LACVAGALLSPGTDILSMVLMTVPILLLYELGYVGTWVVHRIRQRKLASAALILLVVLGGGSLGAQEPARPRPPKKPVPAPGAPGTTGAPVADGDTTRPRPNQPVDSAMARRLGLPTAPSRSFAPDDSVLTRLLQRPGFHATRFRSDSAVLFADERRIHLTGEAMTERGTTTLEADSIAYQEASCLIEARGDPALFDRETILTGAGGIRYNTCIRRGIVTDALTSFPQEGTNWILRGNLAQDSVSSRLYASEGEISSCDLPTPHYHFSAHEVKWISKTIMVARPAVLYVRDVPVLWLPFVFQDGREGRRSGILVPRFGINDILRQDPGYDRHITNIGYYWAPNEYFDVAAKFDWYSNQNIQYGAVGQYRWLNRFVSGRLAYNKLSEFDGLQSTTIQWGHRQNFSLSTSLNLDFNYASRGFVNQRNAFDPVQTTQQITSAANFTKRFWWGAVQLGGNRRQNLSDNSVSMELPSLAISPKPLDIGRHVTWYPGLTMRNSLEQDFPLSPAAVKVDPSGGLDTVGTRDSRTTTIGLETPLRIGGFAWRNSLAYADRKTVGRVVTQGVKIPDPASPGDSITVSQVSTGDFATEFNWETGVALPPLMRSTLKLQPAVGVVNTTGGAFAVRNARTNGDWVTQGKRFNFGLSASPVLFGFFPGIGPVQRIRHSLSPVITYSLSPAADINPEYANAVAAPGTAPRLRSDPTQLLSVGLSNNFEGKTIKETTDSAGEPVVRRFRILGIQTSAVQYDFEQAKLPGRTGWRTQTVSNQLQSDLLTGFSLSLTHDLWDAPVGSDTANFDLFLRSVTASAAISGRTVKSVLRLFGIGRAPPESAAEGPMPSSYVDHQNQYTRPPSFSNYEGESGMGFAARRGFTATLNYSLSRDRSPGSEARKNLGLATSFMPTRLWQVAWSTQYNITDREFESQVIRLERILHEWRASFNFTSSPNGNFGFFFSIHLTDLPDIKFDYNQNSFD
ncbi:MAG: putative LPS assembly protein LptD, partial [Gemmatimonadota bacterium]|nr:putative LPS assembly protein LptD [Gemmatimonadota bacterium]